MKKSTFFIIVIIGIAISAMACERHSGKLTSQVNVNYTYTRELQPANQWLVTSVRTANTGDMAFYSLRSIPSTQETARNITFCDSIRLFNVGDTLKLVKHVRSSY